MKAYELWDRIISLYDPKWYHWNRLGMMSELQYLIGMSALVSTWLTDSIYYTIRGLF